RQPELLRETHQAQRLSVAFGARHAVVAPHALLRVAALLVADDDDRLALEAREAADERMIVRVHAVAVQLVEVGEAALEVVERVGTLRVACELCDLPRAQVREDAPSERLAL